MVNEKFEKLKFGVSGLGGVEIACDVIETISKAGLKACEIAFVHSPYISEKDAVNISKCAIKNDVVLSIHASYYINLASEDEFKRNNSIKRILDAVKIGNILNGDKKTNIIFHPGYYKENKELTKNKIIESIKKIQEIISENNFKVNLCPETMGKVNVFGSYKEIKELVLETGCSFCIDFAHILAREKKINWDDIFSTFSEDNWHIHFSGINYGEKGEKNHILTDDQEWINLIDNLIKKNKSATIICESPDPFGDSIKGLNIYNLTLKD